MNPEQSLQATRTAWDELAREDPFWAVLTCFGRGRHQDREAFFAHGEAEIERTLAWVDAVRPGLARGAALDFGCGVGRLTQALGDRFERVLGVDVAPAMIENARALNRHGERVRYLLNPRPDLSLVQEPVDFAISLITLQHVPPAAARAYLRDLVGLLRPGGVLVFQMPARRTSGRARQLARRLLPARFRWLRGATARMEMYGMRPARVHRIVEAAGGRVADARTDDLAGSAWESRRYLVTRA